MVKNMPDYAKSCKFIVCRVIDGEKWFYGAYNDSVCAANAALEISGCVEVNEDVVFFV